MKEKLKKLLHVLYRHGVPFVLNRGELPFILNARSLVGEGAEVGVKHGQFSEYILTHWKGRVLHSIDAWKEFAATEYRDGANVSQAEQDRIYTNTCTRLGVFGERSHVVRALSSVAAEQFDEQSLDFVYIDAAHDYENARRDMEAWLPKIRPGGIMAGHDYMDGMHDGSVFGVKSAVNEFAQKHRLRVKVSLREPDYKSWFIFL
jgi:hypothetical protein